MKWSRTMASRANLLLALAAMLALFVAQFHPLLTERLNLAAFQDNTFLLGPVFHHVADCFKRGEYPFWMETIVGGLPLYDSPQFSSTYPFYFFRLASAYSDPLQSMLWLHRLSYLHLAILLLNSFVMLRLLRLPTWPSLFGASLLAFSPNMVDYASWVNGIAAYSWLPLVVGAVVVIAEGERAELGILLGSAALALLMLASPAHALIHAVFIGLVIQTANAVRLWRTGARRQIVRTTGHLVVMGLLALVLAAPGVFPVVLDNARMVRFGAAGDGSVPFQDFLVGELSPAQLAATLLPFDVPAVTGRSFLGLGAVLLALLGVLGISRRWFFAPFVGLAAYGLLSATGQHLGFAQVNHVLPLINMIREPPRHLILFVIFGSILAAFGVESLDEQIREARRPLANRGNWAVAGVFGVLVLAAFRAHLDYRGEITKPRFFAASALSLGLLLASLLLGRTIGRGALWLAALTVIATNMQYPMNLLPMEASDYFDPENRASHEALQELARMPDAREYRFLFSGGALNEQFWCMNASYYGLRTFEGYMNPLPRQQFEEVFGRATVRHYYPLLGAKYFLCQDCDDAALTGYRELRAIGSERLYVNDDALPRHAVLSRIAGTFAGTEEFFNVIGEGFDYKTAAYLDASEMGELSRWLGPPGSGPARYQLDEQARTANRSRLSVVSDRPAIVLFNEYYTKDWKARVNGADVAIHRINLNQIGVLVEKGSSEVSFEYRPTPFVYFLQLQRASFALLGLYVLGRAYRRAVLLTPPLPASAGQPCR